MSWIYWALLAPFLFSITNYLDKIILDKYSTDGGIGGVFIISGAVGIITLPILLILTPADLFSISPLDALLIILQGAFILLYLIPYFLALQKEEPSKVIPLFQFISIFSLIIEYFWIGTTISNWQFMGMILIIIGGILITLDPKGQLSLPHFQPFLLMLLSCLIISIGMVLFKDLGQGLNFWTITCYSAIGNFITAMAFYIFHKAYRKDFLLLMKSKTTGLLQWNLLNESINISAGLAYTYCFVVLSAPIALVAAISGTQPLMIFMIGVILTFVTPKLHQEKLDRQTLVKKLFCLILISLGAILIA